jgi:hypothetical protein
LPDLFGARGVGDGLRRARWPLLVELLDETGARPKHPSQVREECGEASLLRRGEGRVAEGSFRDPDHKLCGGKAAVLPNEGNGLVAPELDDEVPGHRQLQVERVSDAGAVGDSGAGHAELVRCVCRVLGVP